MEVIDRQPRYRSIADALAYFDDRGGLDDDRAEIRVHEMGLPDGNVVALVAVVGWVRGEQIALRLTNAIAFKAKNTYNKEKLCDISEINGATVDNYDNTVLNDGTYVHAIDLIPKEFYRSPTDDEMTILVIVINELEIYKLCCREVDPKLLPGIMALDFGLISKIDDEKKLKSLKAIAHSLEKATPLNLPSVSRQKLADVLARAGLRSPRSGRRARRRQVG